MDSTLTPGGQAIYLCELPTGSLLTPYDAQQIRTKAVTQYGWEGLRRAQLIAAFRNAALMPEGHGDRHAWAHAAALFVDPEGLF